ncbi:MAG: hypothetical protein H0Z34_15475 [Brevibacillus sp.]|nr:hypothetical protein [Brevibacillus sp.]
MNTSGAFFALTFQWPTSDEAILDRFTAIRRGSVKTMSRCRREAVAAAIPCGYAVSLAGRPNRSLAKNRPHSPQASESFAAQPVPFDALFAIRCLRQHFRLNTSEFRQKSGHYPNERLGQPS